MNPTLLLTSIRSVALVALVLTFANGHIFAQQRTTRRRPQSPARTTEQRAAAARVRREREAIDLIIETAAKARTFDNLDYRARIQTLAADALWCFDEQRARTIFRRAWDAAAAADKDEEQSLEQDAGASLNANAFITAARDEVLIQVAAHDSQLAEVFLNELNEEKQDAQSSAQNSSRASSPWHEPSANGARHLALAFNLLARNEPARAVRIAQPVINEGVSGSLMAFLLRLREQNAVEADALYVRLLERTGADAAADANAVLLLSSPVVSPQLLVVVDAHSSLQFRSLAPGTNNRAALLPVSPSARNAFYKVAAAVLRRSKVNNTNSAQEATALYFATGRLLPFYEREAARYAPELRARQSALLGEIEAGRRDSLATQFDLHSLAPERAADPLRSQSEQLARAKNATERERMTISLVKTAARNRLWDRAHRAADGIENQTTRRAALSFIAVNKIADITRAYSDDRENDFESVAKFVRDAEVPPFAAAWGFAQAAVICARSKNKSQDAGSKSQNVAALLDEAERAASRVDMGTPQRVAAYGVVATAAAHLDPPRAWQLLAEVVRAANSAPQSFTGDEVSLNLAPDDAAIHGDETHDSDAEVFNVASESFRLDKIFATMTRLDFDKTVRAARALEGDVPQAYAYLAIARVTLEPSKVDK